MPSLLNTAAGGTPPSASSAWPILSGPSAEHHRHRQTAFRALRPVTTQLLVLRDQPERLQPQLVALRQLLQELPPEGVEGCWDYVAFPLTVLLDAVVPSRQVARRECSGSGGGEGGDGGGGGELVAAACRSDRVVEALLGALLALLECCQPDSGAIDGGSGRRADGGDSGLTGPVADRSVAALQHLAPLLQLGREDASEEVHVALQRCVAVALAPLAAPSTERGGACRAAGSGAGADDGAGGMVLCREDLAPLAGFMVHGCLEVSEREVLAGHRGSKALCAAALNSLGLLCAALGNPDVMAFFLPGVVSGLSKHLYAAGTATALSGPSAPPGSAATVRALACLRAAVTTVLSDESTAAILGATPLLGSGTSVAAVSTSGPQPLTGATEVRSAQDALSALQRLSIAATTSTAVNSQLSASSAAAAAAGPTAASSAAPPVRGAAGPSQQRRRLRVERTLGWLEDTSGRINTLLGRALPPLCPHPRPAVRAELAATVAALLDRCSRALAPLQPLLLRLLFTLAQDEWQHVAAPCQKWVARRVPPVAAAAASATAEVAAAEAQSARPSSVATAAGTSDGESSRRAGAGASAGQTAELKALEDEFERFMQGLMSDSVLLEQPALDLDERELYGGSDEGAGDRDQGTPAAPAHSGIAMTVGPVAALPVAGPLPPPPPPPALPGLQHLLAESATSVYLLRAVRSSEAEAVVQARCLTTALLVAGPGRVAEWLLLRPAALADLLAGLVRCFTFDRNAAVLVLHLRGEAGSYAPAVATSATAPTLGDFASRAGAATDPAAVAAATGAREAAAAVLSGGRAAAAELPRMPLGLLYLASQRSYSALAAVARSLGRLARAADAEATAAAAAVLAAGPQRPGASSALRRLIDEICVDMRRALLRGDARAGAGGGEEDEYLDSTAAAVAAARTDAGSGASLSWQCEAAAVVAVAAEVVIGASNAWSPPLGALSQAEASGGVERGAEPPVTERISPSPPFPAADPVFESILQGFLQDLMRPAVVKLPTHNMAGAFGDRQAAAAAAAANGAPLSYDDVVHPELAAAAQARRPLTAQALGENVMLLRVVLEAVGTAARALGPRFATQGRLLRTVLVPLLELLGDPSPPVAAAADIALHSICSHCGYGGSLSSLLAANADYLVDAMCARLRDLQRHPRAPHLLAALLRRAGVAPQLLPLMAEPLQRTLQGLSPLARHWAPQYAHSYLGVLRELAAGATAEAAEAGEVSRLDVAELNRLAAEARDRELAAEAAAEAAAGPHADGSQEAVQHEDVRRYFIGRNAAAAGGEADAAAGGDGADTAEEGRQRRPLLTLTAGQLEDSELRFRRLHAAAVVAGAAAEAATPLLLSSDLRAAIAASEVLRGALAALAATTPAVEAEAAVVEAYGGAEARMRPVRPETPKVLPAVAAAWGPLMGVLRDARTPVVERGVAAVAELVAVAGGPFLARRFQQEAWPVLQRLLTHGSAHTPGLLSLGTDAARSIPRRRLEIGPSAGAGAAGSTTDGILVSGGEDAAGSLAPAAVTRVRVATLRCLEAVCRCRDAGAAVRTLTWGIAQAALPFLGVSHPPTLHEAAEATVLAVAALDPDGIWLLLYDTSYNMPPALAAAAAGPRHTPSPLGSSPGGSTGLVAPGPAFPALKALLPPLPTGSRFAGGVLSPVQQKTQQWPVTVGLAVECGQRAQSLLGTVAALQVPWHGTQIPALDLAVE